MKLAHSQSSCLGGRHAFSRSLTYPQSCYRQLARKSAVPTRLTAQPVAETTTGGEKYTESYGELRHATASLQGAREDMQDFLNVVPKAPCGFLCAGVFDGHGGDSAADYLSRKFYEMFSEEVSEEVYGKECSPEGKDEKGLSCTAELSEVFKAVFAKMDKKLLEWLHETQEGEERQAGSTATVVLARTDKVVVANVGDSRAVLCRNGQPQDLSTEHRVEGTGETVEAEVARVKGVGGWIEDGRVCDVLAVSRAFGDAMFKGDGLPDLLQFGIDSKFWDEEFAKTINFTGDPVVSAPDVVEIALREDDEFIILASDGLWDVVSSKDAVDIARKDLQKGRPLKAVAEKLANIALRRYSQDNIAVILIDLGGGKEGWGKKKSGWGLLGG